MKRFFPFFLALLLIFPLLSACADPNPPAETTPATVSDTDPAPDSAPDIDYPDLIDFNIMEGERRHKTIRDEAIIKELVDYALRYARLTASLDPAQSGDPGVLYSIRGHSGTAFRVSSGHSGISITVGDIKSGLYKPNSRFISGLLSIYARAPESEQSGVKNP